ncbi:MAG: DUF2235 domain-containing protein [Bacteroidota bacterium]
MKYTHIFDPNLPAEGGSRNLVFCFDGTWNDPSDVHELDSDITNILKIHRSAVQDQRQQSFYFQGVGTGGKLDQIVGGATGAGASRIRNQAFVKLVRNYRAGDRIYVFGFSRGAAIARLFSNLIEKEGIPQTIEYNEKKNRFKTAGTKHTVGVRFLGLFDTVASFGLAVNIAGIPFQQINLGKDLAIGPSVEQVVHLVALHEDRNAFTPTLVEASDRVEEVWFPGVHSDVGGGYSEQGISDNALTFMMARAEVAGLRFSSEGKADVRPNLTHTIHDRLKEDYPLGLSFREVFALEDGKKSIQKPKIHQSVLDRYKRLGESVPAPLERLAGHYEIVEA